jgi:hypothetical protein
MGPLPDLDLIPLQNRTAVIFSDANFNCNSKVQAACRAFARELRSRGAVVRIAITPEEPNVNGPDDFLACHTDDEFLRLIENATEFNDAMPRPARNSQADKLVELAEGVEFFHADVDQPYASIRIGGHTETWPVHSKGFKHWLSGEYYRKHQKAPSSQALQDALNVLAGRAVHGGKKISVHTRVAEHAGNLCLDLADEEWRAIEITREGWNIITDVPVKFIRPRGMLPIASPVRGGSLDELKPFLNVADDESFALVKAFLIATIRPNLPFAFLVLTGEQGSGKTAQSVRLKSIVDPGKALVRGLPRELRDLAIAARNGWLLAFDNITTIPHWLSDALCSLSTGGGFSTRELYSDADEMIFDAMRPVILNGIGDIVTRPDLLDRSIVQELPVIPEDKRKQESELQREFESARPRILGALLDAAVVALHDCASVRLESLPRMADFATWAFAAEPAHSPKRVFLTAYGGNRASLHQVAIDTSMIGPPILQLLNDCPRWSGLLTELLEALKQKVPELVRKSLPSIPRQLKSQLTRLAPNLRQIGIQVTFGKRTHKGIPVTLERSGNSSSASSP